MNPDSKAWSNSDDAPAYAQALMRVGITAETQHIMITDRPSEQMSGMPQCRHRGYGVVIV